MARYRAPSVLMLSRFPRSLDDLKIMLTDIYVLQYKVGFEPGELEFFAERIWQLLTSCENRRLDQYEKVGWWYYSGAAERSDAYKKFLAEGLTRSLVAADARVASAKIEGDVGIQLFLGLGSPGVSCDRVLNGPTSDVWIDPWRSYLCDTLGVQYHTKLELDSINCVNGTIESVTVVGPDGSPLEVTGDYYIVAVPVEVMGRLLKQDRHKPLLKAAPALEGIIPVAQDVAWMNGLQLYLKRDVPIVHGHTIYIDSPWAITSISQKQFWPNVDLSTYGDGQVRGIISVDISDWKSPGSFITKPADKCSRVQIKDEVWDQLKASLNVDGNTTLRDEDLHTWFLDPDIGNIDIDWTDPTKYKDAEPLFLALTDKWHLRPDSYTGIPNLFLAADYVRTYTQVATMEAANEAARRAVNGIIAASGADVPYCKLWNLHEPAVFAIWRWYDQYRYNRGLPWTPDVPWLFRVLQTLVQFGYRLAEIVLYPYDRGIPQYRPVPLPIRIIAPIYQVISRLVRSRRERPG